MATQLVHCSRCGQERPGLAQPPLAGWRGRLVQQRACAACWQEWQDELARLINHYRLQVTDPADRQQIYGALGEFLRIPEFQDPLHVALRAPPPPPPGGSAGA